MTNEEIAQLEAYALTATKGEWWWMETPTKTVNAAVRWVAHTIRKSTNPTLWGVGIGAADTHRVIAFTGNGADGEANSAYLIAAQPRNILMLISEVRRLQELVSILSRESRS